MAFKDGPGPSLVSGGLSALGSLASNLISNRQQRKRELDRRNYDQEMWDKIQRYNHPLQQMDRLKQAGLNPNLIYGSSPGSAVGNAGAIPAGQAPQYQLDNPVQPFFNASVQQAQSNNLRADVMLKGTQSMKNLAEAGFTGRKIDQFNDTYSSIVDQASANATIAKIKADIQAGTKGYQIQQSMTKTNSDELALKLKQIDLDYAQQGYPKGLLIPQIASALGFNLQTAKGREGFQIASIVASTSRIFQMLTPGFKSILPKSKGLIQKGKQAFQNWRRKF